MAILTVHVDDFIFCGIDTFQRNATSELKIIFKVRTHENETFKFWGLNVKQTKDWITIDQNLYTLSIYPKDKENKVLKKK